MSYFSISSCILDKVPDEPRLVTELLHKFSSESTPYKVVVDSNGVLLDIYKRFGSTNDHVRSWISLLTATNQIEYLDVTLDDSTAEVMKFVDTARKIRTEKQLIVYSPNNLPKCLSFDPIQKDSLRIGEDIIRVFSSGEAIKYLVDANTNIEIKPGGTMNTGDTNTNIGSAGTTNVGTGGSSVGNTTTNSGNTGSNIATGGSQAGTSDSNIASGDAKISSKPPKKSGDGFLTIIIAGAIGAIIAGLVLWYFFGIK